MRRLVLLLTLTLAGCQSSNPYQGAQPVTPVGQATPAELANYPATPIDYSRLRTWSWRHPPTSLAGLDTTQVQQIVSAALDQRGLRPALPGQSADLSLSATAHRETRTRQVYDEYGYGYPAHRGHGYYGHQPVPRYYQEDVAGIRLQMSDAATGQPLWEGHAEVLIDRDRLSEALRQAAKKALADYPPR